MAARRRSGGGRPPGRQGDGFWLDDAFETTHAFQAPGAYAPAAAETTLPLPVLVEEGPPRRRFRRFLYRFTLTVASLTACLAIGFGLLLVFTPSAGQATQIAARFARQHGTAYPGPPVPGDFARPLIATEDHRFYSEIGGIDPLALIRAAKGVISGEPDQGGATLELQLAKLLYIGDDSPQRNTLTGKLTEVALAVKLDSMYSKAQILRLYAEVAYYGHGYYGLQQASCGYFGRPPAGLTVTQGAMLAGVVNAPTLDDPIKNPAQAHARLAHVIERMVAVGDLTAGEGQAALAAPLALTPGHSPNCQ
jgi:membrane carboxypeptidase/penicillin-binding protein PbpC